MKIRKFNEEKLCNYIISYNKNGQDVDMSIGATDLLELATKLQKSFTQQEFESIFKIEVGIMSFG